MYAPIRRTTGQTIFRTTTKSHFDIHIYPQPVLRTVHRPSA